MEIQKQWLGLQGCVDHRLEHVAEGAQAARLSLDVLILGV